MAGSGKMTNMNEYGDDNLTDKNTTPSKSTDQGQNILLFSPQNTQKLDPIKEKPPQPKIDF